MKSNNSFIAYHSSPEMDCGDWELTEVKDGSYKGNYKGVVYFGFNKWDIIGFSKYAKFKNICTFRIPYGLEELFDATNDNHFNELVSCLKSSDLSPDWVSTVLANIESELWTAFDPNSWPGVEVFKCLKSLGFAGWLEREHPEDEHRNFALLSPKGLELLDIEVFCDCGQPLEMSKRGSLFCSRCDEVEICPICYEDIEWLEDEQEWVVYCAPFLSLGDCDFGERRFIPLPPSKDRSKDRANPYSAVEDLTLFCEQSPEDVIDSMEEHYPKSVKDPQGFLEDHPEPLYTYYYSADFIFIGSKGRMLRIRPEDAEWVHPVQGNIFTSEKICAIADAPSVYDFKIPFLSGYCEIYTMDCEFVLSELENEEEDYYEASSEDVGNVFFQIRDGNHRTFGVLASGNDAYVRISDRQFQDYKEWVSKGKPPSVIYEYLDDNLI